MRREDGKIVFESPEDLPITPMSLGTTDVYKTGAWKYLEPYYQDLTPPCVDRCLVRNDIVQIMRWVHHGDFKKAAQYLLEYNPLPAVLGRVCPHPCEQPCNRKAMGGSIRIQAIERFLGDYALEHRIMPEVPPMTEPPIAVVGAGPAGLSAAYFLRRLGHDVTVYEKSDRIGGLLWSGIPPFRLPRNVLEREIQRFHAMGIRFELNQALGRDIHLKDLRKQYAAVILAIGLGQSRPLNIPGEDHPMVMAGTEFLRQVYRGSPPSLGKRVVVVGGGNTAIDCARTLLRLGHTVQIVYRRSRAEMPAIKHEVQEALEEGVTIEFLTQPVEIVVRDSQQIVGIRCVRMRLGEPDASGRRRPIPIEGSEFVINADAVITALGETLDVTALDKAIQTDGWIHVYDDYTTNLPGVYACGDCVGAGGTVGEAVRMGREVAYRVHAALTGESFVSPDPLVKRGVSSEVAKFKMLNRAYFREEPPAPLPVRNPKERVRDFQEIQGGLSASDVQTEAMRCFKCGTCTLCDNCRIFCPDAAIVRKSDNTGYEILYDYCKGCGVCVEECPRAAIHLRRFPVQFQVRQVQQEA